MFWVIVEGRLRPPRSPLHAEGLYQRELAELFIHLGAHEAFNWDGGGSTTLVKDGNITNHLPPQERPELGRAVGSHFGAQYCDE